MLAHGDSLARRGERKEMDNDNDPKSTNVERRSENGRIPVWQVRSGRFAFGNIPTRVGVRGFPREVAGD